MKLLFASLTIALAAVLGLTACSTASSLALPADAVVIDVRSPEEFSVGHLEGAENIDVQADDFDDRIAALPATGNYVIYCQSGNRSAAAAERMKDLGLPDVTDAGAMSAAANSTGLAIVVPR